MVIGEDRLTWPELLPASAHHEGVLVWRWPTPMTILSSAPVRGGRTTCTSTLNIGVPLDYGRTDLSVHAAEVAVDAGLRDDPVALLTAADVTAHGRGHHESVRVSATVGVTKPTWAADPAGGWNAYTPGTINVVVQIPVPMTDAALVGAVITVTEAKTQALMEHGVPGTGTASDAVAVLCPPAGTMPSGTDVQIFAGPRSEWGSRVALAAHEAITNSLREAKEWSPS